VALAQSFGAFCFGIAFSVLRRRTGAVWLLAVIHALGDLMLKITGLHGGLMWAFLVGHDTLMLLWGLWCLRGAPDDVSDA
jgi:membrane protease YdiL (CAAX protease family)